MRKSIAILIVLALSFTSLYAQRELKDNQYKGKIIMKNGKEKIGIIELKGNEIQSPWSKQEDVKFISEENFKKEKIKRKDKEKFSPKDIQGFYAADRYFESAKYSDMSAVGASMIPKWYFMEKLVDGKIDIYRFYRSPGKVGIAVGEEEIAEMERFEEECRTQPDMLIKIDDDKIKNVLNVDIYDYIAECETVVAKYKNGDYGIKPLDNDDKKGVGKFVSKTLDANRLNSSIIPIAEEFNICQ